MAVAIALSLVDACPFAQIQQAHPAVMLSPVVIAPIPDIAHDHPLGLTRDNFAFVHTFPYQTFGDIEV